MLQIYLMNFIKKLQLIAKTDYNLELGLKNYISCNCIFD